MQYNFDIKHVFIRDHIKNHEFFPQQFFSFSGDGISRNQPHVKIFFERDGITHSWKQFLEEGDGITHSQYDFKDML